ncbi:hypothetical protein F4677DRAFT_405911 [Hypoxylon crocopeplum]|nr:hypothetical protein F4677DRAFT_405911 [Hypoxylon crocopeplum]
MSDDDATTIVGALGAVLSVLSVALRFYSRHFTKTGFGWDDWLILLALLAIIATDILVLWSTGIDPDGAEIASNQYPDHEYTPADIIFTKANFVATVLYYTITSATKLSILLMYRRLFSISASFRRQVLVVSLLVVIFWIGCTVADLLNCIPIEWTWLNSLDDPRYCFNYNIFWMATGVAEALLDVLIIVMPVRVVLGLQLTKSKKIAVVAVFLLGAFVIFSGLVKVILSYAPGQRNPSFGRTALWTTVHSCTGILCACLPVCWPLFVRLAKSSSRVHPAFSLVRKHWYSFSGWSAMDRSIQRGSTPELERNGNVTVGNYELPRYNIGAKNFSVPFHNSHEEQQIHDESRGVTYQVSEQEQFSSNVPAA